MASGAVPALLAAISAPRHRRLVDHDLAETGTVWCELFPEPGCHLFDGGIIQARNVIQVSVIQLLYQRPHRVTDPSMIVDPTSLRVDLALNRHFDFETVTVHFAAFMAGRRFG